MYQSEEILYIVYHFDSVAMCVTCHRHLCSAENLSLSMGRLFKFADKICVRLESP